MCKKCERCQPLIHLTINILQVKPGIDRCGYEEHVGEPLEPLPPDLSSDGSAALLTQPAPPHHARPQLPHEQLRQQLWGRQRTRWSGVRKVGLQCGALFLWLLVRQDSGVNPEIHLNFQNSGRNEPHNKGRIPLNHRNFIRCYFRIYLVVKV